MTFLWHALTTEALKQELRSNIDTELTDSEAQHRLATVGLNELPEAAPPSPLMIFLSRFTTLIVWVLIGAAAVSSLLLEWIDKKEGWQIEMDRHRRHWLWIESV